MNILIIGGTYFLGRVFTMLCHEKYHLTLVNRGHYTMSQYHVQQYHFDRHDQDQWQQLSQQHYDAIVDFCAYQKGDIETVAKNVHFDHYIFISTVDVYQRGTGLVKQENHPLEYRYLGGEMGQYIASKVLLEHELQEICDKQNKRYTSIRPGNIYGPFNYAPRESELIKRIINGLPLINITDADAYFQLVYVKDVVKAIQLILDKKPSAHAFNVVNNQQLTYTTLNQCLSHCAKEPVQIVDLPIQDIHDYPLVYPLIKAEEELYDGHLIETLGLTYTSLEEGMAKTYEAFAPVFKSTK